MRMETKSTWPLSTRIAAIAASIMAINAMAYRFEAHGILNTTVFDETGGIRDTQSLRIVVAVDDTKWLIKAYYAPDWYLWYGCDGTNVYSLTYDPQPSAQRINIPGHIMSGTYPLEAYYPITLPWLAYCSSFYLKSGEVMPAPWSHPRSDPIAHIYLHRAKTSDLPPHLPMHVRYEVSDQRLKVAASHEALRIEGLGLDEAQKRSRDFRYLIGDARLGGEYQALATTNHNGLEVPTLFTLKFYRTRRLPMKSSLGVQQSKENDHSSLIPTNLYLVTLYEGIDFKISDGTNTSFLPVMERDADIADFRLRNRRKRIDGVTYRITNQVWPSESDPGLRNLLAIKEAAMPSFDQKRLATAVLIFTALLLPVIAALWLRFRRNKQTQTATQENSL